MKKKTEAKNVTESVEILKLTVGTMEANCYIVSDSGSSEAAIIDPGAEPDRICQEIARRALQIKCIINTHGHGDHIGANGYLGAPVVIHRLDRDFLLDPEKNLSSSFGFKIISPPAARLLEDGERIELGCLHFEVIHTPGHTPGSICLKLGEILFTGDTLFNSGIGRSDFPYSDECMLLESIRSRLLTLSRDTQIYPGHGPYSTIGEEIRVNTFLGENQK